MTIETVRTTAFRLSDENFGEVFAYRAGARFAAAWRGLEDWWRSRASVGEDKYLPYGSLAVALRVLSRDFVALQRRIEGAQYFVLSRRELTLEDLSLVLRAWEAAALRINDGRVSRFVRGSRS